MPLREALLAKVEFWEGCLKRPLAYRCEQCPDGDYSMDVVEVPIQVTTGKMVWKRTQYAEEVVTQMQPKATYRCDKCGHERGDAPFCIGPLFSFGSAAELDSCCKELRQLLEENP